MKDYWLKAIDGFEKHMEVNKGFALSTVENRLMGARKFIDYILGETDFILDQKKLKKGSGNARE